MIVGRGLRGQYAEDGEGLKALQGIGEIVDASSNVIIMGAFNCICRRAETRHQHACKPRVIADIGTRCMLP